MHAPNIIETGTTEVSKVKEDLIHFKSKIGAIHNLEEAKICMTHARKLNGGKKYYAIIDVRMGERITGEARTFYEKQTDTMSCAAIVIENTIACNLVNLVLRFQNKPYPIKMFTSEREAMDWVDSLQQS